MGPFDPGQVQIHDVNPGDLNDRGLPQHFPDGGLFWTRTIPEKTVTVRPGRGDAAFKWIGFELLDYLTVVNAVFRNGPAPIPSQASVDIEWKGAGQRLKVVNEEQQFSGQYESATATAEWSIANSDGYMFSTANSSARRVTSAFTAHVKSGSFRP